MKKRIALLSLLTLLCVLLLPLSASAACTVSVSASVKEVVVGNTVNVTFTFKDDQKIASVDAVLEYDNTKLSYTGYSTSLGNDDVNAAGQVIKFSAYDYKKAASACTLTVSFKALELGNAKVELRSSDIGDSDGNLLGAPTASVIVTVKAKPEEKLSSDCSLKDLQPPKGTKFDQAFASGTLNYTCTVPYSVDKFPLEPITNHAKAKVEYIGSYILKVGTNTRQVRVTAEDGTTRTYTVTITRKANDATAAPTATPGSTSGTTTAPTATPTTAPTVAPTAGETVTVSVNGKTCTVASPIDLPLLPGFTETDYTLNGKTVSAIRLSDKIIMELDDGITSGFFFYDPLTDVFSPYRALSVPTAVYTVMDVPTVTLPETYHACTLTLPEVVCPGWTCDLLGSGYTVLSVINNLTGERLMAVYCEADGTVQRLSDRLLADPSQNDTEPTAAPTQRAGKTASPLFPREMTPELLRKIMLIALAVLAVLVLIILILMISYRKNLEQDEEQRNLFDVCLDDEPEDIEPVRKNRKQEKKKSKEEDF